MAAIRTISKTLLLSEVVVCFAPAALTLLIGTIAIPLQIAHLLKNPVLWADQLPIIGSVVGGIVGLATLIYVIHRLLRDDDQPIEQPVPVLAGIMMGVAALIPWLGADGALRLIAVLPLACTAHVVFLSRRLLFPHLRQAAGQLVQRWLKPSLATVAAITLVAFATRGVWRLDLEEECAAWLSHRPEAYSFRLEFSGDVEPSQHHPRYITVQGDRVTSARYAYESSLRDPSARRPPADDAKTMNTVFEELIQARSRGARVRALFDQRWGYVKRAYVDYEETGEGWDLSVEEFRPASVRPVSSNDPSGAAAAN